MPDRSCFPDRTASATTFIILLIVAGFILAGGCISPSRTSSVPATATPLPSADAGIRIITEELPPFNYAGADGKAAGQSTEVVQTILTRLNQKAAIEILPWSEGYAATRKGPGVALYSTGRTEEREHLFKWVGPISAYDFTFYARNGSGITITGTESAKTAGLIGVVKDDARHQYLVQQNFTNIVTCDTDAACVKGLLANKTDLWFGSAVNFPATVQREGIDPAAVREVYQVKTVPMYVAFSNDTPDSTIAAWQGTLDAMKQDGTFAAIRQKYGLSATI